MELLKRKVKIFILSGKARSGKDEVADIIKNYYQDKKVKKLSFAYYLKLLVKNISNWNGNEEDKPRDLLQYLGIELIKNKINKKLLINRVLEDIAIYSYFCYIIVITDARLIDEVEDIKKNYPDAISIRINRLNDNHLTDIQKKHVTETGLDNYHDFDYIVDNDVDYDNLRNKVIKILEELKNE